MMPAIFVLDVPEFRPLVDHARDVAGYRVDGPRLGYWRVSAPSEMRFVRKALGFKPAVWHGALTGGLQGHISYFDNDSLHIQDGPA